MSISDRLSEIGARIVRAREGRLTDRYMVLDVDAPALVAALRAVLDVCEWSELGWYPEPKYDEYTPGQLDTAERVRAAITAALGEA